MKCDTVIIGGGPAGKACAEKLSAGGQNVIMVDQAGPGGSALASGYFISKVLISAAEEYGMNAPDKIDNLIEIRREKARLSWEKDLKASGVKFYSGKARITGKNEVEIVGLDNNGGNAVVETDNIVLASGSRPVSPLKFSRDESERIITYEELMTGNWLKSDKVVILGADVEGCEFASLYDQLNTEVMLIEQEDRILPNCDREIAGYMKRNFIDRGIEIKTSATIKDFYPAKKGIELELEEQVKSGADWDVDSSHLQRIRSDVLILTGAQRPVLPGVEADIELEFNDEGFLQTDKNMHAAAGNIYAAGDIVGGMASANAARQEGRSAAAAILDEQFAINYSQIPFVFFCSPRVTGIGLREDDITPEDQFAAVSMSFDRNFRALSAGEDKGLVKLVIDEKQNVLVGAHLLGDNLEEVHAFLTAAVREEIPLARLREMPFAHPTRSEIIGKICRRYFDR